MDAVEVMRAAADRLEARGWCQGSYARSNGKPVRVDSFTHPDFIEETSLVGALRHVGALNNSHAAVDEAKAMLRERLKVEWLEQWNDESGRTVADVTFVLRAAGK
jgi:hypothetical protein